MSRQYRPVPLFPFSTGVRTDLPSHLADGFFGGTIRLLLSLVSHNSQYLQIVIALI